jgi:type II secretory pathway pseudopilin PulG
MKLVETIGALLILAIILPILANMWMQGTTAMETRQAADQLLSVSKAAAKYIRENQATLLSQASTASGPTITTDQLVASGLLPSGFSGRNVWRQSYQIYVRQPTTNTLQAVILTSGGRGHDSRDAKFATATVPSAAALAGGAGGFVPTGDVPGHSAGSLRGAFGGWTIDLAGIGITSPGAGHLGALTTFDSSSLGQDFLYRVAVPGHEELNAMQTDLDMTEHAINNIHEAIFTSRTISDEICDSTVEGRIFLDKDQGLYLCRNNEMQVISDTGNSTLFKNATLATDGDLITKPTCPSQSNTSPQIFVTPTIVASGSESPPLTSLQAWATSLNDAQWQVHLRVLTTNDELGWVYPTSDFGRILVFTTCAKGS